jgi:hypothetical protein
MEAGSAKCQDACGWPYISSRRSEPSLARLSRLRDKIMMQQQWASLSLCGLLSMLSINASNGSSCQTVESWRAWFAMPLMQRQTLNDSMAGSAPARQVHGRMWSLAYLTSRHVLADRTWS